ncbi:MAG: spermidine/putrescine ABC transporter substrate-binding protein [Peptoniphilaceae bacterium]|nr:spermidine/putrescine ABC transporter substrate-binding protein [Peptoniphilaceae bacterium]MDD7543488.1 spermidine/putrescine ABC transporter substrate-binding protein [Peptoniphilaceae bacterium]MDY5766606.1 spermidine/putrescine ABC transporter substrate-binding protein [Peptoniphilaceae bacterium]
MKLFHWKNVFFLLGMLFLFTGCDSGEKKNVVNIYNWGEYIDPELVDQFEKETGIDVIYSNYATNEDLYVKLKSGGSGYDLIVPSDYMIERMVQEEMLLPIDFTKIPNMKYVDQQYLHHIFDPDQKYSVPYFWGTLGILYNKTKVEDPVTSWDILWNPKYERNIIMLDSSRDSIGIGLIRNGFSMNSRNAVELAAAKADLTAQYPLVYAYLVDQTKDIMINGEASLAVMYSGDALAAMMENEDLDYAVPKEGSNLFFDAFAIPKGAKNKENAEKFINFMLEPENMAQNAEWVGYSLPSESGRRLLPEEYRDSPVAYPEKSIFDRLEVFDYPGAFIKVYDTIWQDIKNR